jgi:phage replication initiation protein
MDKNIFTSTLDWLAFTVPQATVDEIGPVVGGDWFETTTGFRGYPTCWLTNQGRHGVGKLGTGATRNAKEVHMDLSAGIVSTWDETKIRTVLAWVFACGGHITRMDVALDDRSAGVSIAQIKQAVDSGQAVTRSQKFQTVHGSSLRNGTSTGDSQGLWCSVGIGTEKGPCPSLCQSVAHIAARGLAGIPRRDSSLLRRFP